MRQAIEVTMEVVQIVRLHPIAFRRCHITPLKVQAFDQAQDWKIFPWWLDRYNELSFPYRRCYCCQLEDVPLSQTDFSRQVVAYGVSAIEPSLEKGQLQSHLFYEPHLRQWLLLHQLTFFIDQEVLVSLARDGAWADVDGSKCDMYNTLRNAFVITGDLNRKADIVSNIEERAQEKIAEAVQRFYGFTIDPAAEIEIVKSAGNITFFFQPSEKEESDMGENGEAANCGTTSGIVLDVLPGTERESRSGYAEKFLNAAVRKRRFTDVDTLVRALQQVHENAERIGSTAEPLHVPDVKLYLFWGRFHTIVSDDESPVVRFMPAHFQAQLLWGFLSSAELIVQQVESGILEESLEKDDASQEFINALINSIQYAHLANEDFKRSLEGDSNNVYCPIEKRWHLEQTLVHLKEFASFLSGYLERNFQKRSLVIEERQNKVLFGIGILGIVALIETWGSFLDLLNGENYAGAFDAGPLRMIFESPEALVQFNMLTPFIVAILCASALVYIFARRGR